MVEYRKLRDIILIQAKSADMAIKLNSLDREHIQVLLLLLGMDVSVEWDEKTWDFKALIESIRDKHYALIDKSGNLLSSSGITLDDDENEIEYV